MTVVARSLTDKMGLKKGMRSHVVAMPASVHRSIGRVDLELRDRLAGAFDYVHLFATTQAELQRRLGTLRRHVKPDGMLWMSWPKNRQLDSDLTLREVIRLGYDHGMVESTTLSIDKVWSAIRFSHPKAGKQYRNSFGQLSDR